MARNVVAGFDLPKNVTKSTFSGENFYENHKEDTFLSHPNLVSDLIKKGKALREHVKHLPIGSILPINGYEVSRGKTLKIVKGSDIEPVTDTDYTVNRLQGICAVFIQKNPASYKDFISPIAANMGWQWLPNDQQCVLAYLSTIPGTEHFSNIFGYWPIVVALLQVKREKVDIENIKRILNTKNAQGNNVRDLLTPDAAKEARAVIARMYKADAILKSRVFELLDRLTGGLSYESFVSNIRD